ncbi:hypothetical protein HID58_009966 [Brassica napus]|uniref:Uncharacterized protein n=1 Tax=Brassica napus TaxID=3708 RepID=A0ABQ8C257_BRANA|nr:hypothetical protein HID58_034409 [Brassica napus]KAH0932849.1 hypothetical protein HID58_009966 [Brassica napus]
MVKLIRFFESRRRLWKLNLSDYVQLKPEKFKSALLLSRSQKRQLVVSDIVLIGEIGGTAEEDAAALIKKVVLRSLLLWYCWTHSTTGKRWNNKVKLIRFLQSHRRRWKLNLSDYVIFWSCEKSMFFCKKCSIFGIGIFFKKKIDSSDPLHQ